jgi:hypothetical protein
MYAAGLGLEKLARFEDHAGFDGVILGRRGESYHLEFTSQHGHAAGRAPGPEHLLVFYVPQEDDWESRCAAMDAAGFARVPSNNPYWDAAGRTYEDLEGYRVVVARREWER